MRFIHQSFRLGRIQSPNSQNKEMSRKPGQNIQAEVQQKARDHRPNYQHFRTTARIQGQGFAG